MNSLAKIEMYRSEGRRVIVFSGILAGKLAAWEGTPQWKEAFELARQLGIAVTPALHYNGPIGQ
jgi:hypothetical protein